MFCTAPQVDYDVTINVKECPKDRKDWKKSFSIYPVGLTEKLTINLDLLCECPCETADLEVSYRLYYVFNLQLRVLVFQWVGTQC